MKIRLLAGAVAMAAALSGCSSMLEATRAPIYDYGTGAGSVEMTGATYLVQPGDTLYSIATRNGCNPAELARANGISDPTTLRVGTVLNLTIGRIEPVQEITPEDVALSQPVPDQEVTIDGVDLTKEAPEPAFVQKTMGNTQLSWPVAVRGAVLTKFAQNGSKGIEIAGEMGSDVLAAAAGRVLYTGDNVSGYGNLIIITHGPGAVTVYGHNSEILVKKGDNVTNGQVIAKMGNSDSKSVNLLFEVRHNDKPVDPIQYLPQ
ncbi:MAG: M23 family metallopeptidase [Burkholderiaceae bacterium]|nr:M23 family metallopeptidase [Burkholderiaceae bacterium]